MFSIAEQFSYLCQVGVVEQKSGLLSGTIAYNIAYGKVKTYSFPYLIIVQIRYVCDNLHVLYRKVARKMISLRLPRLPVPMSSL